MLRAGISVCICVLCERGVGGVGGEGGEGGDGRRSLGTQLNLPPCNTPSGELTAFREQARKK